MYNHANNLALIPNTVTPVPHITLTDTKQYYDSELSSIDHYINLTKKHSSEIHVIPEKKKRLEQN